MKKYLITLLIVTFGFSFGLMAKAQESTTTDISSSTPVITSNTSSTTSAIVESINVERMIASQLPMNPLDNTTHRKGIPQMKPMAKSSSHFRHFQNKNGIVASARHTTYGNLISKPIDKFNYAKVRSTVNHPVVRIKQKK